MAKSSGNKSFKGDGKRIYWITGASSGIGMELARALAKERHYVFVSARSEEKLACLKEAYPENIGIIPLDVTDPLSMATAEKLLREKTDHLDTLVACAGTCEYDDNLRLPVDLYDRVTRTNYLGTVETVRVALPLLRKSRLSPHIAAVSSLSAVVPFPRAAAYGASKAALDYFLQSLQIDLKPENISVTSIRPGFVDTPLTQRNDFDMPFIISSKDAAARIVKALHKRPMFFDFPRRLAIPMKIMRCFPSFWRNVVAQKIKKEDDL